MGWPGFASVSEPPPQRFQEVVEADEFADDAPAPRGPGVPEAAARSVADGASLTAVARYFGVPESELQGLLDNDDQPKAEEQPEAQGQPKAEDIARPGPPARDEAPEHSAGESNPVKRLSTPRPTSVRQDPIAYAPNRAASAPRRPSDPSSVGLRNSIQVLRRRLPIVAIAVVVCAAAGWVTAPGKARATTTFRATHTAIYDSQGSGSYNIEQAALLATTGEVPSRVAARLNLDRRQVRAAVSAVADGEVATISITARSAQPAMAETLANVTAEELTAEFDGNSQGAYQADLSRLTKQVETARNRFEAAKTPATQAQARAELDGAERALQQHQAKQPKPHLRTLEAATAAAVSPAGVRAPNSRPVRAVLLGIFGLLLGIAGAFVLDRLDSRIRSKGSAEDALGVPVVAEVPRLPKASQGQMLARSQSSSPFVEAYRGLRTYVALWAPEADREDGHRVIVVTSPSAGEGKTTTVAHLAAMLAEVGRSVVVISADLRRPRLHQYFDLAAAPGLVEALNAPGDPAFSGLDKPTSVRGVRLVPSGPPTENPAPLFEHAGALMEAARGLADFVLVDAPPLLVANDALELARYADGVLLVARSGQTPVDAAERSAEMLERLEIPVVGAVLVASEAASTASRYYAARYYAEPDRAGWRRRRPAAGNGHGTPAPEEREEAPADFGRP